MGVVKLYPCIIGKKGRKKVLHFLCTGILKFGLGMPTQTACNNKGGSMKGDGGSLSICATT